MVIASKIKSSIYAWLCVMVVVLGFGETCAGAIFLGGSHESGQIAAVNTEGISDFYDAYEYDASGYAVAPGSTGKYPLALYDPKFAATQVLDGGQVSLSRLKSLVPDGTPNTFKPSSTIEFGQKYQFEVNGTKMEVKFHSPDLNAAQKFPGSNSGTQWTAQIKVGNKLLGADGKFYKKPSNNTHIPIVELP